MVIFFVLQYILLSYSLTIPLNCRGREESHGSAPTGALALTKSRNGLGMQSWYLTWLQTTPQCLRLII
jgi:hypothetical protein